MDFRVQPRIIPGIYGQRCRERPETGSAGGASIKQRRGGEMAQRLQRRAIGSWHWRECQEQKTVGAAKEPPREPTLGQGWFDARSNCMYIWDGVEWVCVPTD
jgi:hypothetical protein